MWTCTHRLIKNAIETPGALLASLFYTKTKTEVHTMKDGCHLMPQ